MFLGRDTEAQGCDFPGETFLKLKTGTTLSTSLMLRGDTKFSGIKSLTIFEIRAAIYKHFDVIVLFLTQTAGADRYI